VEKEIVLPPGVKADAPIFIDPEPVIPLGDKVLLSVRPKESLTRGGIVIPEVANVQPTYIADILAVGPGKVGPDGKRVPIGLTKSGFELVRGDVVVTSKFPGQYFEHKGRKLRLCPEEEILAVITDQEKRK
jgi:co-chaperonin GroES (HSP10)